MSTTRPILFSGPMVRALLSGQKSQTRRMVKLPRWMEKQGGDLSKAWVDPGGTIFGPGPYLKVPCNGMPGYDDTVQRLYCPYGYPEEEATLWVREAWTIIGEVVAYKADWDPQPKSWEKWRPSIHLPRAYSRISLRITKVRAERLQDISEEDAAAEGAHFTGDMATHRGVFEYIWNRINGAKPGRDWASNPWVWALTFERMEKAA